MVAREPDCEFAVVVIEEGRRLRSDDERGPNDMWFVRTKESPSGRETGSYFASKAEAVAAVHGWLDGIPDTEREKLERNLAQGGSGNVVKEQRFKTRIGFSVRGSRFAQICDEERRLENERLQEASPSHPLVGLVRLIPTPSGPRAVCQVCASMFNSPRVSRAKQLHMVQDWTATHNTWHERLRASSGLLEDGGDPPE